MEYDNLVAKNISYLRARDPSILAFNRPQLAEVKTNLVDKFGEVTQLQNQNQDENIRVYLRIKNGYDFQNVYEINANKLTSKIPPGSILMRNVRDGDSLRNIYTFTKIFKPETTQRDVFNNVVRPKILDFMNGQNSTLLTYGASGSGKTFTVIGTDEEPGLVPRSLDYLFRTLPKLAKNPTAKPSPAGNVTLLNEHDCKKEKLLCRSLLNASCSSMDRTHHLRTYMAMQQRLSTEPIAELEEQQEVSLGVWVSFAEIYNEHVYDLLQLDPPRGQQRPKLRLGMSNGQTYIKDLTSVNVTSGQEAYQILQFGIHNLNYAPTQINKHSSRSHSIFTIKLVQVSKRDGGSYISCFYFCDLAGSERSKKTNNVGDRLKESNNINNSLLVLGRCISAVRDLQKHDAQKLIPFRESKLTQLFQKALSGSEDIAMIVNISPSQDMFDETQHVLNFSAVAKSLIIDRKQEPVVHRRKSRFSQLVEQNQKDDFFSGYNTEDYKRALLLLKEELEIQKRDHEVDVQFNLNYAREEYLKELKKQETYVETSIKKAENAIKIQYEGRLESMRLKYERVIEELKQRDAVIRVESSNDEENADKENTNCSSLENLEKSELRKLVTEGMQDFRHLKVECQGLQQKYNSLEGKMIELEQELEMYKKVVAQENFISDSEEDLEEVLEDNCTI